MDNICHLPRVFRPEVMSVWVGESARRCRFGLVRFDCVLGCCHAELLQPVTQASQGHVEQLRRMDTDTAGALERLKDEAPFGFTEDLIEIATFVGQSEKLRADARRPAD